jgi:hypothetical protein
LVLRHSCLYFPTALRHVNSGMSGNVVTTARKRNRNCPTKSSLLIFCLFVVCCLLVWLLVRLFVFCLTRSDNNASLLRSLPHSFSRSVSASLSLARSLHQAS